MQVVPQVRCCCAGQSFGLENDFGASHGEAGRAGARRNAAPWVHGSVHPMEDTDLCRSSLASPLVQDLLWSRLN